MTKVINIIGAPGVGKTVMASLIYAELKMKHYSCELVQEYVKQLIWAEDYQTIRNQFTISTEQYKLLRNVNNKVQYIVTDGSLFHGLYYNKEYNENVSDIQKTERAILNYLNEFTNVWIFLKRGDYPYENAGRIHTFNQSQQIEIGMRSLIKNVANESDILEIKSDKRNVEIIIDWLLLK